MQDFQNVRRHPIAVASDCDKVNSYVTATEVHVTPETPRLVYPSPKPPKCRKRPSKEQSTITFSKHPRRHQKNVHKRATALFVTQQDKPEKEERLSAEKCKEAVKLGYAAGFALPARCW